MVKAVFNRMMEGINELKRDVQHEGWEVYTTRKGTIVLRSPTLVDYLARKEAEAKKPK